MALDQRAYALIRDAQGMARETAQKVARRTPQQQEELFQIGMAVICEMAPLHCELTQEDFQRRVYKRVHGAMLDALRKERKAAALDAALLNGIEPVLANTEFGDLFASPEQRKAEHKRAYVNIMAAAALTLAMAREVETPEAVAEQSRLREAISQAMTALPEDDRALVEEVLFHHRTFEEAGAKRGISKSAAWKRIQKCVEVLAGKMRKEG